MATRELSLFADLDQGRLVQSYLSTLQAVLPRFVFGDAIPVSFRPLKSNGNNSVNPWREVDLTGKIVRIAIGSPAGAATSGTFTLSYGGDTTAAIAYNADGAAIQTALNALASITSAGGVVVTRAGAGAFRIVFNTAGTRTAITASTESLYPSSGAEIRVAVEGSVSAREIVVARLEALPAAFAELSDEMPVAASEIAEIRQGVLGVAAVKASGAFYINTGTVANDTFTIGAVTFTFKASASNENEVTIGVDDDATLANAYAKINAHSSVLVSAVNLVTGSFGIEAKTAGTAGNSIATTVSGAVTFDGATLSGGVDYVAGIGAILSLDFSVLPYSGAYSLEIGGEQTLGIPWDADASTLQAALELLSTVGAGKVIVSGEFPAFTLNFDVSLGDIGAMTIDMSGLVVPKGRVGSLDTNTAAMIELLNGAAQATAKLEIELYDTADYTTWTVLQIDCVIIDDVIGNAPASITGGPRYITIDSATDSFENGKVFKFPDSGSVITWSGASLYVFSTSSNASIVSYSYGSGAGVIASAMSAEGLIASSNSNTYIAKFNNDAAGTPLQVAIARVRGWVVWFYSTYLGTLKTQNITANRDWTLPDKTGIVGTLDSYADSTAANAVVSVGDSWWDSTLKKVRTRMS